jgi:homoserine O-acetyltransferase/O-succinyltransferase
MMDSHHVGRGRKSIEAALGQIEARTLVVAVDSDLLFPPSEQEYLAEHIPDASLERITSAYGHDGFLVEFDLLKKIVRQFLQQQSKEIVV